jgi:hypothetical protein
LHTFFRCFKKIKIRPIVILDEFDAVRKFSNAQTCFHILRELASNPDFKIGLVLIAKRELSEISQLSGHDSDYWSNVLLTINVRTFRADEAEESIKRLDQAGVQCTEELISQMFHRCGNHPYLLDLFGFHAVQHKRGKNESSNGFDTQFAPELNSYFTQVEEVLRGGRRLKDLVQILIGPVLDANDLAIQALIKYGALEESTDGEIAPFAPAFLDHLRCIERSVDYWPLWRDTERGLREALTIQLETTYGSDWEERILEKNPRLSSLFQSCRKMIADDRRKFGIRVSTKILDYTYPMQLYEIMASNWHRLGTDMLGGDCKAWASKFSLLAKVRTPLAHNRAQVVTENEKAAAQMYCNEILELLHRHSLQIGYKAS